MEFYSSDYKISDFKNGDKIDYEKVTFKYIDKDFDDMEIHTLVDPNAFIFSDEIQYIYLAIQAMNDSPYKKS